MKGIKLNKNIWANCLQVAKPTGLGQIRGIGIED